ncbi:hypothetical protein CMV30_18660 [Nibricoccus aquaticus]|uniref:Uncharacterized protein n=1 Tax=Nibricoccus aquaticus TaxID=2576891 RepID=A0A290QC27_9BACT|nr:hypothetical protein CMV30_18660 [Nibricoccus aquaticus]
MNNRVVRFSHRQNDAVHFRDVLKKLPQLGAQQIVIDLAEEVEFAIFIEKAVNGLHDFPRYHDFAMPVIDGTVGLMGEFGDFTKRLDVLLNGCAIHMPGRFRVVAKKDGPIKIAAGAVGISANLETIHVIVRGLGDDPAHVGGIRLSRMHDGPGDFRRALF